MSVVRRNSEQGDTLIEVLVALSVFAIVAVSAFSIVNKGVSQMYDSLERTQVRMLIDQQIESLTYARDQYLRSKTPTGASMMTSEDIAAKAAWESIDVTLTETSPDMDECSGSSTDTFYFTRAGDSIQFMQFGTPADSSIAGGFPSPGDGLYIQYRNSSGSAVRYKDFFVRACWQPTSSSVTQNISTIVRLYED